METEIKIVGRTSLDETIEQLIAAREAGQHVFCKFNGHILHSDGITYDSAYLEVTGCTKAESKAKEKKWIDDYLVRERQRKAREKEYAARVARSRLQKKQPITMSLVIQGLKFIAENPSMTQEELLEGLLQLGCNFTFEDIKAQIPSYGSILLYDGMHKGEISTGASVIVNARDSEFGRSYCDECFLSCDDDTSIYHFIRVVTGDETYTKESISAKIRKRKNS